MTINQSSESQSCSTAAPEAEPESLSPVCWCSRKVKREPLPWCSVSGRGALALRNECRHSCNQACTCGAARLAYGTQGGLRPGAAEWLPTPVDAARLASADEAGAFQPAVASVPSG